METTNERYPVGSYAKIAEIGADIHATEVDAPLGQQTYGRAATRTTFLQGDDAKWAINAHAQSYDFPLTPREDFYTVMVFGNEDSPYQVWGCTKVAPDGMDAEWERLA